MEARSEIQDVRQGVFIRDGHSVQRHMVSTYPPRAIRFRNNYNRASPIASMLATADFDRLAIPSFQFSSMVIFAAMNLLESNRLGFAWGNGPTVSI